MAFTLLGVPSSAGAYGVGQERAPAALREAGLVRELQAAGVDVVDDGDLPTERFRPDPSNRSQQSLGRVVAVAQRVARRVERIAGGGSLPLVVGGDCTITLGVVAGLAVRHPRLGLAYFDGDADLSTPRTTRSGILDAMGVAHLLGRDGAAESLAGLGPRRPLLPGNRLALIGLEETELDDDERALLDERAVHVVPDARLRDGPSAAAAEALAALEGADPLVVHFDVDAVDSTDCPLAHFPHFNTGVSLAQAGECLAQLCTAPNLGAIVVTEVNPDHDPDGRELRRLIEVLVRALSGHRA